MRSFALAAMLPLASLGCAPTAACRVFETVTGTDVPFGNEVEHQFAADGRPIRTITRGRVHRGFVRYHYDERGLMTRVEKQYEDDEVRLPHPSPLDQKERRGESATFYTYDADGHCIRAERGDTVVNYQYRRRQLARIRQWKSGVLVDTWRFQHQGSCLSNIEYWKPVAATPSMQWSFGCSSDGRPVREEHAADFLVQNRVYEYDYDEGGRLRARWLVSGDERVLAERLKRDGHGRVVAVEVGPAGGGHVSTDYRYDHAGRLVEVRTAGARRRYRYESSCTMPMTRALQPEPVAHLLEPHMKLIEDSFTRCGTANSLESRGDLDSARRALRPLK